MTVSFICEAPQTVEHLFRVLNGVRRLTYGTGNMIKQSIAAGLAAGNGSARNAGRTEWNEADYRAACVASAKADKELKPKKRKAKAKPKKRAASKLGGRTTIGEPLIGQKLVGTERQETVFTAKEVTLPNGKKHAFFWYVPDGYTRSGKLAPYVSTALELKQFKANEAAFLRQLDLKKAAKVA